MGILERFRRKNQKSGDSVKVVSIDEIKKQNPPEIDGYSRIAEFQKTGIPYFLRLERAGSKKAVANIDIYSFQVTKLRDLIADKYGGDTYIGTLVDADMKAVLIPKRNEPERYTFRIDGPPPREDKPKKEKSPKPEPVSADKIKEILTVIGGFLGPAIAYFIKVMESRGDSGEKTLAMAKELMSLSAGPSVQDVITMITGILEGTTKLQTLTHPVPPITTGDGAAALSGQGGLLNQFISGLGAGLAPAIQGLMGGNNRPQITGQTPQGQAIAQTPQTTNQLSEGNQRPVNILPPPDIAGKLLEMANRNESPEVIAEQIVTLLDGYRRSSNPIYPQFAHYLDNPEMAFDTIVRLFPVLTAWPGRADKLREIVYEICRQIKESESENELYTGDRQTGPQPGRQGAGLFDQTPIRVTISDTEGESPEPEPKEDTIHRAIKPVGGDENENPDGQEYGGPGPVHSAVDQGEAGEAE